MHFLVDKTGDPRFVVKGKDAYTFYARCGYKVRPRDGRKPAEFSVWTSDVDCHGCLMGMPATA